MRQRHLLYSMDGLPPQPVDCSCSIFRSFDNGGQAFYSGHRVNSFLWQMISHLYHKVLTRFLKLSFTLRTLFREDP